MEKKNELIPKLETLRYDQRSLPRGFKKQHLEALLGIPCGAREVLEDSIRNPGIALADFLVSSYRKSRESDNFSFFEPLIQTNKIYANDITSDIINVINSRRFIISDENN